MSPKVALASSQNMVYNEAFLRVTISTAVRSFLARSGVEEDFIDVDVFSYNPNDDSPRAAIFVAFIQDFNKIDPHLEEKCLNFVVRLIQDLQCSTEVDDINVNKLQWRKRPHEH